MDKNISSEETIARYAAVMHTANNPNGKCDCKISNQYWDKEGSKCLKCGEVIVNDIN